MSTFLSKLVKYLSETFYSDKYKDTDCKSHLDLMSIKDIKLGFFEFKANCTKVFNKELIKSFKNTHKSLNGDIYKPILLLRKGVYPYESIDSWDRFDETLSDKKLFIVI